MREFKFMQEEEDIRELDKEGEELIKGEGVENLVDSAINKGE